MPAVFWKLLDMHIDVILFQERCFTNKNAKQNSILQLTTPTCSQTGRNNKRKIKSIQPEITPSEE